MDMMAKLLNICDPVSQRLRKLMWISALRAVMRRPSEYGRIL